MGLAGLAADGLEVRTRAKRRIKDRLGIALTGSYVGSLVLTLASCEVSGKYSIILGLCFSSLKSG